MAFFGRLMAAIRGTTAEPIDHDFLDYAASHDDDRVALYSLVEDYYRDGMRGEHAWLIDRARTYLERSGLPFAENFCEPIIDVFAERLTVTGFTADDKDAAQTAAAEAATSDEMSDLEGWLSSVWARNRMDAKQGTVHTQMLLKGDMYAIVDLDAERGIPRISLNMPEQIPRCVYDAENADRIAWASKVWNSTAVGPSNPGGSAVERLNVYYPDRVEKFFRITKDSAGNWERWHDNDDHAWPTPWVRPTGEPLGVPVIHFRHKPLGHDCGRSELRPSIPLQDELTKMLVDLIDVMDSQGWPQRWGTGLPDTATLVVQPGTVLKAGDKDAKFGQFDPANPAGALAAIEGVLSRLARRSRTPMHLLVGGTPPSGEALKTAESGLVAKVESAQTPTGNSWEDVMLMGVKLAADAGLLPAGLVVDEQHLVLSTVWADAESRNDLSEAQTAEILDSLGVSRRTIHARLGLDYEQERAQRAEEQAAIDEAGGRLLDAGGAAPTIDPAAAASNGAVPAETPVA